MSSRLSSSDAIRRRRRASLLLASLAACAFWATPSADAATVTVGSPMTMSANGASVCVTPCTWANTALGESGANVISPISGTIVRWRLAHGSAGGPFELRVIHPAGGGLYTGSGTSSPAQPVGSGEQTFTTNLPIQAGDLIGLNAPSGSEVPRFTPPTSTESVWNPPLPDGTTATAPSSSFPGFESLFNADVESDTDHDGFLDDTQDKCVGTTGTFNGCPNTVALDMLKQKGTKPKVTVKLTVPGAGTLKAGSASTTLKPVARTLTSTTRQQVTLTLKLTASAERKLAAKGKLNAQVKVVYTPPGGPAGTQTGKVKLMS